MYRKPAPDDSRLEKMWDERDHIRVKISLAKHADEVDNQAIADLYDELRDVERRIEAHERANL